MKTYRFTVVYMLAFALQSSAALLSYTFDESNVYAAYQENTAGVTVSDIAYLQGATSDATKAAGVAYQSNIPADNMFSVCSLDLSANATIYATDVSRLEMNVTANAGNSVDFTGATLSVDLAGITTPLSPLIYKTNLRLAYNINGAGWVTDVQKQVDTTLVASSLMDAVLFDNATDALLDGYGVASGAYVHEQSHSWNLSDLGTLGSGDIVEFALLIYDSRNSAVYYTGVDNIKIDGLTVIPEPVALGIIVAGACPILLFRRLGLL